MHSQKTSHGPPTFEPSRGDGQHGQPSAGAGAIEPPAHAQAGVRALNQLRVGELAAAATYNAFLSQAGRGGALEARLALALEDHRRRAHRLAELVVNMGGRLASEGGSWGFFETMAEPMAMTGSDTMALALMEEGERFGVREYHAALNHLDGDVLEVLESELLPQQVTTQREVSRLLTEVRAQRTRAHG